MSQPLVSICIPAYNAENYLGETLDNILAQTYKRLEIIVVNDGSTDRTKSVLEKYIAKGVKVLHQENKGQCAAANAAFKASSGEYIKFFDADDLMHPELVALQVAKLQHSKTEVASAEWARFYNDDVTTARFVPEKVWKDMKPEDWLVQSFENGLNMMQCGLFLIPREILNVSGLWDERLSLINDFDFFIRVLLSATMVRFTKGAKLLYRSGNAGSLSQTTSRKAMESAFLSTNLGINRLLQAENSKRTRKVGADQFQIWLYKFHPVYADIAAKAEAKVREYGGSSVPIHARRSIQVLAKIIGWKNWYKIREMVTSAN